MPSAGEIVEFAGWVYKFISGCWHVWDAGKKIWKAVSSVPWR